MDLDLKGKVPIQKALQGISVAIAQVMSLDLDSPSSGKHFLFWMRALEKIPEALLIMKHQIFGRIIPSPSTAAKEPEEIGALAAFLRSKPAGYINGQAIGCNSGLVHDL